MTMSHLEASCHPHCLHTRPLLDRAGKEVMLDVVRTVSNPLVVQTHHHCYQPELSDRLNCEGVDDP